MTGWRKGQIAILMGARGVGKSVWSDIVNPPAIKVLDQELVDGETWYTVQCKPSIVSSWVQEQDPNMWRRTDNSIDQRWYVHFNVFDMHEKLFTMLMLKWK